MSSEESGVGVLRHEYRRDGGEWREWRWIPGKGDDPEALEMARAVEDKPYAKRGRVTLVLEYPEHGIENRLTGVVEDVGEVLGVMMDTRQVYPARAVRAMGRALADMPLSKLEPHCGSEKTDRVRRALRDAEKVFGEGFWKEGS